MKYHIEKNSVQETLIIPLYGRALCTRRFPELFSDPLAEELLERIDYDFSRLERRSDSVMQVFGALEVAMRQSDLAWEVRDYLTRHPRAAVVNLGCGLDQTGRACDNGACRIYNVDLPEVIAAREQLIPIGEREQNLSANLNDLTWCDAIHANVDGAVFFAAGVFYYFQTEQVRRLCAALAERFPGGRLVFDAAGPVAVKLMLKTWIRQAAIRDVNAYFSVKDAAKELEAWSNRIAVSSRGYMQGYQTLRGSGIRLLHRLLARIADGPMKLQIVRMDFAQDQNEW
ncbi:MAG TPA: class I SAM-dependent methyltransferase [Candidatus Eisenbergiella merdavium]|uniref:Class I SAM-dependent methyltransferase n=1 Tax=Candidatus Eisenbergiella merdavium TaxID=2838551 RepID=A0A9D2NDS9_9FIRM|nr:class I SAM-dependent methyltransferase [Candidatus Eisenbergiella merdavium]